MPEWVNSTKIPPRQYKCGFCGKEVASKEGYYYNRSGSNQPQSQDPVIYICGGCSKPSHFDGDSQTPAPLLGNEVEALPENVARIYKEARQCTQVEAFTACVLACRKLLMQIAVAQGADPGKNFFQYVEFLAQNHYIPPNGEAWVHHIRKRGNEANHEIVIMSQADAFELLSFVEMLLKFIYEFPARLVSDDDPQD